MTDSCTVYFAAGATFTITDFNVAGSTDLQVFLRSTDTAHWYLNNTGFQDVSFVAVEYSSAIGKTIMDSPGGVDLGDTFNWVFARSTFTWTNLSGDNLWSNPVNWSPAGPPPAGSYIVFDPASSTDSCSVDVSSNVFSSFTLMDGYDGTVTFQVDAVGAALSQTLTVLDDITVSSGALAFTGKTTTDDSNDAIPGNGINDGLGWTLYADNITPSMERAMTITDERRQKQKTFNAEHDITPQTIKREVMDSMHLDYGQARETEMQLFDEGDDYDVNEVLRQLETDMFEAAAELEFERAAMLRDQIAALKRGDIDQAAMGDDDTGAAKPSKPKRRQRR